jgi:hypothetical protein
MAKANLKLNYPTEFKQFELIKSTIKNKKCVTLLNRFIYRYRLAKSFKGINVEGIGKTTVMGYSSLLNSFLVYTAFELIAEALKAYDNKKYNYKTLAYIYTDTRNEQLKDDMEIFYKGYFDNIIPLSYAIRNCFSHGELTSARCGLNKAIHRKEIDELSKILLSYCDELFGDFVRQVRIY